MSLHIEKREIQGIVIPDLKGPLNSGHGDSELPGTGPGTLALGLARLRKAGGRAAPFPDRALKPFDILNFVQHKDDRNRNHGTGCAAAC